MIDGWAKSCSKCGEDKPLGEFYRYEKRCLSCRAARARERYALHQIGISTARPNEWPEERREALLALYDEGLSCREIGERLGTTKNAVIGKLKRLGYTRDDGTPVTTIFDRLQELHDRLDAVLKECSDVIYYLPRNPPELKLVV